MNDEITDSKQEEIPEVLPSPLRCWTGTAVAGSMSFAAYLVTRNVIINFANNPPTGNTVAMRIAITVRTLLMGICTMATAVFGMIAIGLLLLGIKSLLAPDEETASGESS
ncbi:hypothetical protein Lepto7376_4133 [[Leptolyngbya] sp. PCC 7376]|nr:DUF3082 domain-containing protein [[Leptolyngbya] sp. PCC 7376]AFY40262.1 hypothetical protein Lepto7376_4133 [[Leptolyngbya] sp. PCC 7376]